MYQVKDLLGINSGHKESSWKLMLRSERRGEVEIYLAHDLLNLKLNYSELHTDTWPWISATSWWRKRYEWYVSWSVKIVTHSSDYYPFPFLVFFTSVAMNIGQGDGRVRYNILIVSAVQSSAAGSSSCDGKCTFLPRNILWRARAVSLKAFLQSFLVTLSSAA